MRYDPGKDGAPRVTAKGAGAIALQIIERARAAGVPIREDAALVEVLSGLDLAAEIPAETYVVVAEILSWVYRMNREAGRQGQSR